MSTDSATNIPAGLYERFAATARRHPDATALEVGGESYTYRRLESLAGRLARLLLDAHGGTAPRSVGLLASRTLTAYAGYLAVQRLGAVVVPLNPAFPVARTADVAARARLDLVLAQPDQAAAALPVPVVAPLTAGAPDPAANQPAPPARPVSPDDVCYILFTSGSTGAPKGVPVQHRSVGAYLDHVVPRYGLGVGSRLSQTFDLTFDLSVFDLFGAWASGGTVVVPGPHDLLAPARFVARENITHWFSVPSVVSLAARLRQLRPNSMPTLRWSLFCGEPLTRAQAVAWQAAAPAAMTENLYGPTELTLSCAQFRLGGAHAAASPGATVPIGTLYPGLEHLVLDQDGRPAAEGELCVRGVQRFPGYLDPEDNRGRFVRHAHGTTTVVTDTAPPGPALYYRTGDRVRVTEAGLVHLGRLDQQVKIQGYRVELGEIEAALRDAPGVRDAVVLAVPDPGGQTALAAACTGDSVDSSRVLGALRSRLPAYMVPASLTVLDTLPLNANGKTDRTALRRVLQAPGSADGAPRAGMRDDGRGQPVPRPAASSPGIRPEGDHR
ncbi:amino acid adenylation domain-containing protein [Streptomyces griseoluteus]|uniref:amino acid adenylation domain-containing protein n=1 Tax=Streptomyces griseoluteus TaxID=29306 RepID=UPI003686C9B4